MLLRGILLPGIQNRIALRHNVHSQPKLMLAGAGTSHPSGGLRLSILLRIPLLQQPGNLIAVQGLLEFPCPVGGTHHRRQTLRPGIRQHPLQIPGNPGIHGLLISQLCQLHGVILRQEIFKIDQNQFPTLRRFLRVFRRFRFRDPGNPKPLFSMPGIRNRPGGKAGHQIPLRIHLEGCVRPKGHIVAQGRMVQNRIVTHMGIFLHPVFHLHGDGICQKLHIVLTQQSFQGYGGLRCGFGRGRGHRCQPMRQAPASHHNQKAQ